MSEQPDKVFLLEDDSTKNYFDGTALINQLEQFNDVILADGTRAILIGGQYLIPTESETVLVPDQNSVDSYFSAEDDDSQQNSLDSSQIVEYIQQDDTTNIGENHVLYYSDVDQNDINLDIESGFEHPLKRLKIENQIIDNIENVEKQIESVESNHYVFVNNDILQIVAVDTEDINLSDNLNTEQNVNTSHLIKVNEKKNVNISQITGKNLLTGQTVTLDDYLEKIKKRFNSNQLKRKTDLKNKEISSDNTLQNLLHKKLTIGRTTSGQKLVAKVIKVSKNKNEEVENLYQKNIQSIKEDQTEHIINENIENASNTNGVISKGGETMEETKEYVIKTLTQLMTINSVKQKLKSKNLLVKVVQGHLKKGKFVKIEKSIFFGCMVLAENEDESGNIENQWSFDIKNFDNKQNIENHPRTYLKTLNLTISLRFENDKIISTKVNINPDAKVLKCSLCEKQFTTVQSLSSHIKKTHDIGLNIEEEVLTCGLCNETQFEGEDSMFEHFSNVHRTSIKKEHIDEINNKINELESELNENEVSVKSDVLTDEMLLTDLNLRKETVDNADTEVEMLEKNNLMEKENLLEIEESQINEMEGVSLQCVTCDKIFNNIEMWRQHYLTAHSMVFVEGPVKKMYVCSTCNKMFSRYSNLVRHSEIHKGIYNCNICGCSYNYASSLTRHIVQSHTIKV